MKPRRVLLPASASDLFDRAVRERALAILNLRDSQGWQTFKSRFLERDPRGRFFVLDYEPRDDQPLPLLTPGQCVGVSFRQKSRKFLFATVVEAKGHFLLDDRTRIPAVRYRWPSHLTELQRRAYYRTPVPEDLALVASMWPGGVSARTQAQRASLGVTTGNLVDLSCGGALVRLHQPKPPAWSEDETLGVELQLPDGKPPVVLDARHRGTRIDDSGAVGVAIQFVGLELSPPGSAALERLVCAVQRLLQARAPVLGRDRGTAANNS